MLIKIISISLLIYLLSCILMFLFQRSFIYFPKINNITNSELINNENEIIFIKSDQYNLKSWYFNSKQNPYTIIFFHGNAGDLELRAYKANAFRELGFNYLIFSYRGFNSNPGKPNEKNIYLDAQNAIDWLKNNIPDSKIIVYGESLGTGVAVEIAKNNNISGLILESPFTSLIDMGKIQFPFLPVKIILKSDLFILSSKYEGLPNVLLEAAVLKKFIISTNCPTGPREILDNGKGGFLFNIGDYDKLSKLIYFVLKNKNKLKKKIIFL